MGLIDVRGVDDQAYLEIVILGGIEDGDVARVQGLSGALEAVVKLVGHRETGRACTPRKRSNNQVRRRVDMIIDAS